MVGIAEEGIAEIDQRLRCYERSEKSTGQSAKNNGLFLLIRDHATSDDWQSGNGMNLQTPRSSQVPLTSRSGNGAKQQAWSRERVPINASASAGSALH